MAFSPTTTPPPNNPKVTVHFAGLLMLKPDAGNGCEVGIHRFSNTHLFQVVLVVSKPNLPPILIRLLTGPLLRSFAIDVLPAPSAGVQAFAPTPEPFVRDSTTNDDRDYRWALNMRALHPDADFNDGARPIATLNGGVLYTPNLTPSALMPELVGRTITTQLYRMSTDLAVAIDLPATGRVNLVWDDFGERQDLTLPRPLDPPNTTYTISFQNNPPNINPVAHDELYLYYRVLEVKGDAISRSRQRALNFVSRDPGTDEIPCSPVILNP